MGLRVGGLVSGLDTNALIEGLMAFERRPLDLVNTRRDDLRAERSLFVELNRRLDALRDAAAALDNRNSLLSGPATEEELLAFTATSSDETVATATANSNANPGTVEISVQNLAQPARVVSSTYVTDTGIIAQAGRTLSIDHGGANPIEITVGVNGASLVDLRGMINEDVNNEGRVRADVIFDGSLYRLVMSGTQTGAANDVVVTSDILGEPFGFGPFVDPTLSEPAEDAELTVLGLPNVTRPSNEISDLLPGLTFNLLSEGAASTQIQVARDDETINGQFQAFIDAYNSVTQFIRDQARFNETTESAGPLSGDSTLRDIELRIQGLIAQGFEFTNNPFTSLGNLGVSLNGDGLLELDAEALASALETNSPAVRQLLGGAEVDDPENPGETIFSNGIASQLATLLDGYTKDSVDDEGETVTAILTGRLNGFDDRIASLDEQIARLELRLEERETFLVRQFTQLESVLAGLQGQQNSLLGLVQVNNNNN
ncbi:MAG: flagellar filament capping protein FliD [Myxococcota bacterium]